MPRQMKFTRFRGQTPPQLGIIPEISGVTIRASTTSPRTGNFFPSGANDFSAEDFTLRQYDDTINAIRAI